MSDIELSVATLRWYRAYQAKKAANSLKRSFGVGTWMPPMSKLRDDYDESDRRLAVARKEESRRRREMLKVCAKALPAKDEPLCIDV